MKHYIDSESMESPLDFLNYCGSSGSMFKLSIDQRHRTLAKQYGKTDPKCHGLQSRPVLISLGISSDCLLNRE